MFSDSENDFSVFPLGEKSKERPFYTELHKLILKMNQIYEWHWSNFVEIKEGVIKFNSTGCLRVLCDKNSGRSELYFKDDDTVILIAKAPMIGGYDLEIIENGIDVVNQALLCIENEREEQHQINLKQMEINSEIEKMADSLSTTVNLSILSERYFVANKIKTLIGDDFKKNDREINDLDKYKLKYKFKPNPEISASFYLLCFGGGALVAAGILLIIIAGISLSGISLLSLGGAYAAVSLGGAGSLFGAGMMGVSLFSRYGRKKEIDIDTVTITYENDSNTDKQDSVHTP